MKKILITEDDKTYANALEFCLQDQHYETLWVPDAIRGFLRANLWHPDLILLDIDLVTANGFQVAKEITDTHIPIIFMTGSDKAGFIDEAKKYNTIAFFHKPIDVPKLLQTIHEALFDKKPHDFVLA